MALTANRDVDRYIDQDLRSLPLKAGARIFKGALVGLAGGFVRGLVAGDPFVGIAYEEVSNVGGADGAVAVRVVTLGDFDHALESADRANNGAAVYASDDGTLTLSAAGNSFAGWQIDSPRSNRIVLRIQTTPFPLSGGVMTGGIVSAGIRHQAAAKASAADVSIGASDLGGIVLVTGTTAGNLNLPAAATAGAGAWCTFVKTGASGLLTIKPAGTELIDGAAGHAEMDAAGDSVTVVCSGTAWFIAAKKIG